MSFGGGSALPTAAARQGERQAETQIHLEEFNSPRNGVRDTGVSCRHLQGYVPGGWPTVRYQIQRLK